MVIQRIFSVALLMLGVGLYVGCSDAPTEPEPVNLRSLTTQEAKVVASGNTFGLQLIQGLQEASPEDNIFISPLSVSMALGMTLNGAEGQTRTEMEEALTLAGLSVTEINDAYRGLMDLLPGLDQKVVFEIANSIWYRDTFDAEQAFLETNQTYFDAEVKALDFNASTAPGTINAWVDDKTKGKIDEIIQGPIDPLVMMYLVNAVYFNGSWRYAFDTDDTRPGSFTAADGTERTVDMMQHYDVKLAAHFGDTYTAVDLPYGDSLYSMTLVMPHAEQDLSTFIGELDQAGWDTVVRQLQPTTLDFFAMPKFTLAYKETLNDVLKSLGMHDAFDNTRADFSGIHQNAQGLGLHISRVLHKTFVEINEEGTEAAAVTAVEIRVESLGPYISIDRPFLFVIRENQTGTLVFVGTMLDPESGER